MGIYDRDYYRDTPPSRNPLGSLRMWSVNAWLIAINVVVFIVNSLVVGQVEGVDAFGFIHRLQTHPIEDALVFTANIAIYQLQFWRLIGFQFLHANPSHLLFNMLGLFFFGPMIENYFGRARYLAFYLICGIGGAIGYLILMALHVLDTTPNTHLIGASAGIFGVLIAAAVIAPHSRVLIYGIIPVKLRTLAFVALGLAVYSVYTNGHNAGGEAAHLGGAALGYLFIMQPWLLDWAIIRSKPKMRYHGWEP